MVKIFYENVEKKTLENEEYRAIKYTGKMQFVYMSLKPLEDIELEKHHGHDQFIRVESGKGKAVIDKKEYELHDGMGIIIPSGSEHQIFNVSDTEKLKLYTIYSPPEHPDPNALIGGNKTELHTKYLKYKSKYLELKNKIKQ